MKLASWLATAACIGLITYGNAALADDLPGVPATSGAKTVGTLLRLKFKVGQVATYHVGVEISGTVTQNNSAPVPMDDTIDMTMKQTVQSIDPGLATLRL